MSFDLKYFYEKLISARHYSHGHSASSDSDNCHSVNLILRSVVMFVILLNVVAPFNPKRVDVTFQIR
jgi:hypothetical protein